ncbi:NAD(P)-binding protein [Coniochaeta ligniaria NRRL 30616]|uniref:NAD(P)-binding protein n=1 Tax=Coniochaeta ligniaria NRRL 30616 TaxID=1408157 RepID=A0A1J7JPU3_9PEZI|nr:NAD(P)-binding protein [Coniochaeta ligniaria NRRL 30616]
MVTRYAKDQPQGFTNRIENVAVVGAGGQIGRHITEQLLKTGKHTVTAITRRDSTAKLPQGVKVEPVNYADQASIVAALRGQQFLVITLSVFAPPDTHSRLVRAAAEAGIPYVLPNWFGGDPFEDRLVNETHLGAMKAAQQAEIESLGISAWIALCCGFWYEFSLAGGPDRYGFDFKERSVVFFDEGTVAINTTTWPQCGRAVAGLLSLKELPDDAEDKSPTVSQFANGIVYTSSFRISQREMFESVKRVTGTTDSDWTITKEPSLKRYQEAVEAMKKGDRSAFARQLYTRSFFADSNNDYESKRGLHNDLFGLPREDLDGWTKEAVRMAENNEVPY